MSDLEVEERPHVIIHRPPSFKSESLFAQLHKHYTLIDPLSSDQKLLALSRTARAIVCVGPTPLTSADLDRYPSAEYVVGTSAGFNHFDLDACRRRRVRVTSAGDSYSDDVADYAVGLVIDVMRRVSTADRFVRSGLWPARDEYHQPLGSKVSGKRVGIVGLGSIGLEIAKRLEAFKCKIAYNSRTAKPDISYPFSASVLELASDVDILILCCALTKETHHIVNKDVMTVLGKEGVIVNVGRGPLIDEKELVRFLVEGQIGGAGLDVFEYEPHVPEELFGLDNVVLSPHNAIMSPESFRAVDELVVSNLEAFFSGKPLQAEIKLH